MNEYQSMEMHHGAVDVLYPPRFESGSHHGKLFDESAFHGGGIAFIDNENISFYVDKFKPHFEYGDADTDPEVIYPVFTGSYNLGEIFPTGSAYLGHCLGPPVEIDKKYLNMLLNAKKLKASVSFNFSTTAENPFNSFTSNATSTGTIEGSFDKLELEILTDLSDPNNRLGHFARRYRRDISSKVAQLNPLSSPEFNGEINEYATESYAISAGGTGGSDSYPTYFRLREFEQSLPHALPRLTFMEDVRLYKIEDINNYDDNHSYSYDVSESDVKSGNYSVSYDVTGNMFLSSSHSFGVGFILVTPTKVYAFPHINGRIAPDVGRFGIGYTSIYSETYPAYYTGWAGETNVGDSINLPPVAVSTMNFFGVNIPIYFYYLVTNYDVTGPAAEYPTASCAGTSFDISVEEEW
jgi:hypothetical protein